MGLVNFETTVTKTVTLDKDVTLDVNKNVNSNVNIDDCLATAEASADAVGTSGNNLAETDTFAQCTDSGAFSFSEALAASSGTVDDAPLG